MNLKTTLFLLLLSGGCVGLYYKGRDLAPKVGVAVPETMAPAQSNAALEKIKPDDILRIVILQGRDQVELKAEKPGQPLHCKNGITGFAKLIQQVRVILF